MEILRGGGEDVQSIIKRFKKGQLDLMICGHDFARTHIEDLYDLDLSCIIVDECHRIKNPTAATTVAFKKFETRCRFGLTGTAIQNDYKELHTILDWAFPGELGTLEQWNEWVAAPLKAAQKKHASNVELATGRERAVELVENLLPQFFLRRTKDLIADQLPKKRDQIVYCPMSAQQLVAYRNMLDSKACQDIIQCVRCCSDATDRSATPIPARAAPSTPAPVSPSSAASAASRTGTPRSCAT